MKVDVTNHGLEIRPESEEDAWALKAIFPPGATDKEIISRILIDFQYCDQFEVPDQ